MSAVDIILIIAAVLAVVEQFNAQGRNLLAWSVILICVALLLGSRL